MSEQALWRGVISQAFSDATYRGDSPRGQTDRDTARDWLLHNGRDFSAVCEVAGCDRVAVRSEAERRAKNGWPALDRAGIEMVTA